LFDIADQASRHTCGGFYNHTYANVRHGDQLTVIYDPADPDDVAHRGGARG